MVNQYFLESWKCQFTSQSFWKNTSEEWCFQNELNLRKIIQYVRQLINADFDICCLIELTIVFIWFLDMDPNHGLVASSHKTVRTSNEMFPPQNIDLPAFTSMHLPTIVSLPPTPNHALMPPTPNHASMPPTPNHALMPPTPNHALTPRSHTVHRTAGPVLEHIAQQQHSNPNESTTNQDLTQETLLMQSRQNKRRPRTQACGDQEFPEFKQHNKYQVADEADEGPESDDDL
jgi:hypothetical protein